MTPLALIDAHHHLWDLSRLAYPWLQGEGDPGFFLGDYQALRRNYLPEDLHHDAREFRLVASVHCEAEHERGQPLKETQWLTALHARSSLPMALVAWAPLTDQAVAEALLEAHAQSPLLRGIRCKPVTAKGAAQRDAVKGASGSLQDPAWHQGLRLLQRHGLSWDLRVPWWHLEEAAQLLESFPDLPVILNHTGLPWDRSPEGLAGWHRGMQALARLPRVAVKVSEFGLPEPGWRVDENRRIVRETLALFGHDRCMFASNFPVAGLRIGYGDLVRHMADFLAEDTPAQQEAFFQGTAQAYYRIEPGAPTSAPRGQ
ncbi:amidohydrolase family protein [Pseudomonas ovata]|uniref:amidohydrolase family protein n=1 Tax=Pseudomonas ovata TaxID=1839709 RepID=UPI000D69D97D|nr:amidohydrolase family protein [Pseudomonas ovata]